MSNALVQLNAIERALTEARTIEDVVGIRNAAEALRVCVQKAGLGLEMQNQAAEAKILAERKAGEMIEAMQEQGELPHGGDRKSRLHHATLKLSDLGIEKTQSHRWQQEASIPEETFQQWKAEILDEGGELTSAGLLGLAKKKRKAAEKANNISTTKGATPTLITGQAEDMSFLEDGKVDLIITSPPYNLGHESWPMGGEGREPREDGIGYSDNLTEDEYQEWQLTCLIEMYRVAKEGASLFYNHKVRQRQGTVVHPLDWLRSSENPWVLRQEIIWDRMSTHNHCPSLFWPHDERVYWMTKGNPTLPRDGLHYRKDKDTEIDKRRSTIWRFHGPEAGTWHPAPFPEELPRRILEAMYRPDIVVLDPFAGSCTTVQVALELGLNAIGVDANEEYLKEATQTNQWEYMS